MKPTLPQPSLEQLRSMAALRKSPQWQGFEEWLTECYRGAVERTLTCDETDLIGARSLASALYQITEAFETAPDAVRETDRT